MTAVDFLHHENPPTWARVEPANLGAEGQRQTSYVTESAIETRFGIQRDFLETYRILNTFATAMEKLEG
ncbi:hypothetical protein TNCV_3793911 [Trichonephila clavipes]|nr:hypothetical protein TNCV_3793911 [Trichonephila clavipes]